MRAPVYQISIKNINTIKFDEPQKFECIQLDTNLTCNLHCLYCHNDRSTKLMSKEDFIKFVEEQVLEVNDFQIGCAMEPTMDKRLVEFAKIVANSKAKPKRAFRLQTNATLLDRHDLKALKEAGITVFTISIDTVNPEVHKELRGGSDLEKILNNIAELRAQWPEVTIRFVTTVNKLNVELLDELLGYASTHKINGVELRRMFYFPDSGVIQDHEKMKAILLDNEYFLSKGIEMKNKYTGNLIVHINDETYLETVRVNTQT